jgi:hypothetical protein
VIIDYATCSPPESPANLVFIGDLEFVMIESECVNLGQDFLSFRTSMREDKLETDRFAQSLSYEC